MSREHEETRSAARRRFLKATGLAGLAATGLSGTALAQETTEDEGDEEDDGLVTVESDQGVQATVDRITTAIEENGDLSLVGTVDHRENAESVGKSLQPTTLVIFGNPNLGTPLIQRERTVGIDLPQRMLVWQDGDTVNVTYNDPGYVADRHGIKVPEMLLERIDTALRGIATGGN